MLPTDFRSASIPQIQERFQEQRRLAQFGKDVGLAMCQGDNPGASTSTASQR